MKVKKKLYNNKITSILFICLGNICRSPAAEAVMKKMAKDSQLGQILHVESAAIGPWHVGDLPDKRMRRHAAARGYTLDSRAQQFNASYFQRFDIIVVMDEENYQAVNRQARSDDDRHKIWQMADYFIQYKGRSSVPDPYYGDDSDFEIALDLIEDGCQGLIRTICSEMNHSCNYCEHS
ncbi:MAG: low molecular weight phosphotyrosine protein phosphatase [Prevotella sp.]|nr:low molecular weight phosphotyrosine protein phosphatase [Prevotella sp.]